MACVHHLVARAFIGKRPKGCAIHHINGTQTDNRAPNLEYKPIGEHLSGHGRRRGRKLNIEDVRTIRDVYAEMPTTQEELAESYGVSQRTISYIVNRERWPE